MISKHCEVYDFLYLGWLCWQRRAVGGLRVGVVSTDNTLKVTLRSASSNTFESHLQWLWVSSSCDCNICHLDIVMSQRNLEQVSILKAHPSTSDPAPYPNLSNPGSEPCTPSSSLWLLYYLDILVSLLSWFPCTVLALLASSLFPSSLIVLLFLSSHGPVQFRHFQMTLTIFSHMSTVKSVSSTTFQSAHMFLFSFMYVYIIYYHLISRCRVPEMFEAFLKNIPWFQLWRL